MVVGYSVCTITNYYHSSCVIYRDKGITGNAVTPFLLRTVDELLGGKALTASILFSTINVVHAVIVINRFFIKLFKSTNMKIIQSYQYRFCCDLPSVRLQNEL